MHRRGRQENHSAQGADQQREWKNLGPLITHEGEEVIYVLSGTIRLITEFYEEIVLEQGDCVYLDSTVGHLCLAHGIEDAEVFWVCSSSDAISVVENHSDRVTVNASDRPGASSRQGSARSPVRRSRARA